eukprot:6662371-Heterocapsa_arctica.AAC.1
MPQRQLQLRLRHHRAHRPGHQVRPERGHLRHRLICAIDAPGHAHPVPQGEAQQGRLLAETHEGGGHGRRLTPEI